MTGAASLSGALPDGPSNGLAALAAEMVTRPAKVHIVLALVDVIRITEKVDDGTRVPTVRIRRIEAIRDPGDAMQMRKLLQREFERRTGQTVLPFELEEDIRQAFDSAEVGDDDPDTP